MRTAELDIEQPAQLLAYLRDRGLIGRVEQPHVQVLVGGVSNRTVLVRREAGQAWVLKQALPKLRVAVDWFSDPARVDREADGLRVLGELAPAGSIPALVFHDPANHLLAMEAVPEPHFNLKYLWMQGKLEPWHAPQLGTLLADIHGAAWQRRDELAARFADRQFFESLRQEPYYAYTATQVPEAAEFLQALIAETRQRRLTLVHGDFSPKNVLVREKQLVLLDHEVIHWGDPTFDLGFMLTHILSKAHHLREQRWEFCKAAVEGLYLTYAHRSEHMEWCDHEAMVVRQTLGCLLARVAGRSTLEYLDAQERRRQRDAVLALMAQPPRRLSALASGFLFLV